MSVIGPPLLPDQLESIARVQVRTGSTEMARRAIRLIGSGISIALVDDTINEEVEITLTTTGAPPTGNAGGSLDGTYPNPGLAAAVAGDGLTETSDVLAVGATSPIAVTANAVGIASGFLVPAASSAAPGSPAEGQIHYDTDDNRLYVYDGTQWVCISPVSDMVATAEARNNTAFGALATAGPAVTIQTGTQALVRFGCIAVNTSPQTMRMSFAVSGATTLAASDANGLAVTVASVAAIQQPMREFVVTGLTAGVNTFTAQYKVDNTTGDDLFGSRSITVVGIP